MSKKSFRENNPALQFITPMQPDRTNAAPDTDNTQNTETAPDAGAASLAPPTQERKSKRLNFLIQPSLHEELVKIAYIKQVSLNELILCAAREYAANNQEAVLKYNEFTEEGE